MGDAAYLIEKHRGRGVFLDANLLVLLLVGRVNLRRIESFKRTQNFTKNEYVLLEILLESFGHPLVATPHVLSQVSDLTDLGGVEGTHIRRLFKTTIRTIDETYTPARKLVDHPAFERFGLGDASIASACEQNFVVVTADVRLHLALEVLGHDSINFNHVRNLAWASNH